MRRARRVREAASRGGLLSVNWLLRHPGLLLAASLLLVGVGLLGLAAWAVLRPRVVRVPDELPPGFPAEGFDLRPLEELLERFVDADGRVDYARWHADPEARAALERCLAAFARYSPENAPERFPSGEARLAYWLAAYNACVLQGVLLHWPLESVRDLRTPLDPVAGLGFFARLRFVLGGRAYSLYELEHERIRARFPDPRVHFVLNCGSASCPALRPELPEGPDLEAFLERAAADFVADDRNVRVDRARRRVHLSQIFSWYREDFLAELARRGVPPRDRNLGTYLRRVARGERRALLEEARDYALVFDPYDWSVNARSPAPAGE
ncbi:MAG: DUF547 domain-containing protein [Planctomycetota bacterium]|nr:MAG: DUF547 domain-containing protein [Planctomycetota bacterium]